MNFLESESKDGTVEAASHDQLLPEGSKRTVQLALCLQSADCAMLKQNTALIISVYTNNNNNSHSKNDQLVSNIHTNSGYAADKSKS